MKKILALTLLVFTLTTGVASAEHGIEVSKNYYSAALFQTEEHGIE